VGGREHGASMCGHQGALCAGPRPLLSRVRSPQAEVAPGGQAPSPRLVGGAEGRGGRGSPRLITHVRLRAEIPSPIPRSGLRDASRYWRSLSTLPSASCSFAWKSRSTLFVARAHNHVHGAVLTTHGSMSDQPAREAAGSYAHHSASPAGGGETRGLLQLLRWWGRTRETPGTRARSRPHHRRHPG
jgi:hypothetical protein